MEYTEVSLRDRYKDQVTRYKSCHLQIERYIITKSTIYLWHTSQFHFGPMYVLPHMCREKARLFTRSVKVRATDQILPLNTSSWARMHWLQVPSFTEPPLFSITRNHIFNNKGRCGREREAGHIMLCNTGF